MIWASKGAASFGRKAYKVKYKGLKCSNARDAAIAYLATAFRWVWIRPFAWPALMSLKKNRSNVLSAAIRILRIRIWPFYSLGLRPLRKKEWMPMPPSFISAQNAMSCFLTIFNMKFSCFIMRIRKWRDNRGHSFKNWLAPLYSIARVDGQP